MLTRVGGAALGTLLGVLVAGCGSAAHRSAASAAAIGPLRAFQLPVVGSKNAAGGRVWEQYGSRPLGKTLTINPVSVYDAGHEPLTLLSIRQVHPVRGLVFHDEFVSLTSGFGGYSEYVSQGPPGDAFHFGANFSPLRGFVVNPDPTQAMNGISPALVLTATATRPGLIHIGNWVITYRVGGVRHTLTLVDDGEFCAGAKGCPSLG
jgi:hypothetical protein